MMSMIQSSLMLLVTPAWSAHAHQSCELKSRIKSINLSQVQTTVLHTRGAALGWWTACFFSLFLGVHRKSVRCSGREMTQLIIHPRTAIEAPVHRRIIKATLKTYSTPIISNRFIYLPFLHALTQSSPCSSQSKALGKHIQHYQN